jgi:biopolymer transport protein ExbD
MMKKMICLTAIIAATASYAATGVNVDVSTPNVRVQVGNQPPPPVTVIERERVVVKEHGDKEHHDNGKHKGHKKHKKHKNEKKHED